MKRRISNARRDTSCAVTPEITVSTAQEKRAPRGLGAAGRPGAAHRIPAGHEHLRVVLQVQAAREVLARAREHHGPAVGVRGEGVKALGNFPAPATAALRVRIGLRLGCHPLAPPKRAVHRVALVRAVQFDLVHPLARFGHGERLVARPGRWRGGHAPQPSSPHALTHNDPALHMNLWGPRARRAREVGRARDTARMEGSDFDYAL